MTWPDDGPAAELAVTLAVTCDPRGRNELTYVTAHRLGDRPRTGLGYSQGLPLPAAPTVDPSQQNRLLAALSAEVQVRLRPHLRLVAMPLGKVI